MDNLSRAQWFNKFDGPRLITCADTHNVVNNVAVEDVAYIMNDAGKTIETIYGR